MQDEVFIGKTIEKYTKRCLGRRELLSCLQPFIVLVNELNGFAVNKKS